jgi:hypothetical protein
MCCGPDEELAPDDVVDPEPHAATAASAIAPAAIRPDRFA